MKLKNIPEALRAHYRRNYDVNTMLTLLTQHSADNEKKLELDEQFHVGGQEATRQLAEACGMDAGATVLDLGCGLGASSRYLASTFGARVLGVDVMSEFIETARGIAEQRGFQRQTPWMALKENEFNLKMGSVDYQLGNVLQLSSSELQMPSGFRFDHVWIQHVLMHWTDTQLPAVWRLIRPLMKVGGRLSLYDLFKGPNGDPLNLNFPLPFASSSDECHFRPLHEVCCEIQRSNFELESSQDCTDAGLAWLWQQRKQADSTNQAVARALLGDTEASKKSRNMFHALEQKQLSIHQVVFRASEIGKL